MHRLALYLLGSPYIERGAARIDIPLAKATALLAYVAVSREAHSREVLATLFWPESDAAHARTSLRGILSRLNAVLGRGWLTTTRKHVALNLEADVWLDVTVFEAHILACSTHGHAESEMCSRCVPLLMEAVNLYRGAFLSGFSLADSVLFDEWQLAQSARLRAMQADALTRLSTCLGSPVYDQLDLAIQYARRRVELDPYVEAAHQHLIQLYLQAGQRAEALRQYRTCVDLLERDLAIPPSPQTAALQRQIQEIKPTLSLSSTSRGASVLPLVAQMRFAQLGAPFVGREAERQAIDFLLRSTADCRLVTLVGPGGIGKTRLAYEVASTLDMAFRDGVVAVNLESVDEVEFILPAVADALGLAAERDVVAQVFAALASRECLLLLDNFEHLMAGIVLVDDILQQAPRVKLLVTSQEPLHLQGEWLVNVTGLHYPDFPDGDEITEYGAVQLFLSTAQRVKPGFVPSSGDWPWIARICRLVDGMPLGIELAARWVRLLTCREIALKIEDNLAFLTTTLRDVPERHRSLRAVFEHTWALLSSAERRAFEDMSVFVGGFDEVAASRVAGAGLPVLLALTDRGLLRRQPTGRYDRHPLLWQYAVEKLADDPTRRDAVHRRHCCYYADFLTAQLARLHQPVGAGAAPAGIEVELQNIRTALNWALVHDRESDCAPRLEKLYRDYEQLK